MSAPSILKPGQAPPREYSSLRPKMRKFVDCYLTSAGWNATEAARQAGYRTPESLGPRLLGKLRPLLERLAEEMRSSAVMSPRECMEGLADEARNPQNKASDRIRARELMLKVHGFLDGNLRITIDADAKAAVAELAGLARGGGVQPSVVEAEQIRALPAGEGGEAPSAGDGDPTEV